MGKKAAEPAKPTKGKVAKPPKATAKATPKATAKATPKANAKAPKVKKEPTSPGKARPAPAETLQVEKGELCGLLTSRRYQTKAKKVSEEHRQQAQKILQARCVRFN